MAAARVGLLMTLFTGLLVGTYALLQRSVFARKTVSFYADFADAGGLATGSKVLMSGVPIGQVAKVELGGTKGARVTLAIDQGVEIPGGTIAQVPSALIGIGDQKLELLRPGKASTPLEPGSVIAGDIKSPLSGLLPDTKDTFAALNETLKASTKTLDGINKLVTDESLKKDIQKLMVASTSTANRFGELAARLNGTLAANQSQINGIMSNTKAVSADMAKVSRSFASYVDSGKLQGNVDALMSKLTGTVDKGQLLVDDLRTLINDPQMRGDFKGIIANTKTITAKSTEIADNANTLIKKGIDVGENMNQLLTKANRLAEDAGDLMKELKRKFVGDGKSGGLVGGMSDIHATFDEFRETRPNRWRSEVNAQIPIGKDQRLHVGLWDAFESNKINAQVGQKFGKSGELRYGVFASKPGAGVDYEIAPKFWLRGDVFGVNKTRFDARARYDFSKTVSGWIGLERIFERNAPSVGIGIRK